MHLKKIFLVLTTFILSATSPSCDFADDEDDAPDVPSVADDIALVLSTDYSTGEYSTVGRGFNEINAGIQTIHSDSVCHFDPLTGTWFIISRMGADSIEILDASAGYRIMREYSVEAGSNPQAIALVSEDRAFVSRYGSTEMLVVQPFSGEVIQKIDLAPYADDDGLPEMASLYHSSGKVYVAVQRLNRNQGFEPVGDSFLLVLDASTGQVEQAIELSATNPTARLRFSQSIGRLVLVETGSYQSLDDGGIEYFDLETNTLSGLVVTESALGGSLVDAVIASPTKGFAIIGVTGDNAAATHVVSFDPSTGEKLNLLLESDSWVFGDLELTPDNAELWISDRSPTKPGVRIFDTLNEQEKTSFPLDVGLPPAQICFAG